MLHERLADQALLAEELLRLLARHSRRVPISNSLTALVMAFLAGQGSSTWLVGSWFGVVVAVQGLRWWSLNRLTKRGSIPIERRLRWAIVLSVLNALAFSAVLIFAPGMSDFQRMAQTLLLLGLCAGSVTTTAGYRPLLLAFVIPIALASSLAWFSGGFVAFDVSWTDRMIGLLIIAFAWVLSSMARDAYRVFTDSVLIRQQQLHTNSQLRLALQQAESAMQAKTRFQAAASHDLRQPMHTLSLLSAALMRRPLDAGAAEIGRHMTLAVQALASQMDALLDISKLDAQVVQVNNQVFCFSNWLARLCQEMRPVALNKGLELILSCPPDVFIESDPLLLERVLRNLIDNAIKYTEQGHVDLRVEAADDLWRVIVCDTGCGVAPDEQLRIFEEFYQIGNPERDRAKGLGLGLSIVSRLVDLLDLHLSLESEAGRGSRFCLHIAAVEPAAQGVEPVAGSVLSLPPLHVLVLDDEEPVRRAMQALLQSHGCEVTCTGSTREALLKCLQRRPDIVLADFRLREGDDGVSAVRTLRNALPGLPAVLITGDTAPERLREAHAAGLVPLHKPVSEAQLLEAMRAALAQARSDNSPAAA